MIAGLRDVEGRSIVEASLAGTALFTLVAVAGVVAPDTRAVVSIFVVVSLVLFAVGVGAFFLAYARAVGRSRHDAIGIGGLYFLVGSAPRPVQVALHASTVTQTVVSFAAAGIRPFTALAFGTLVPMLGLGLGGLWSARHGSFGDKE